MHAKNATRGSILFLAARAAGPPPANRLPPPPVHTHSLVGPLPPLLQQRLLEHPVAVQLVPPAHQAVQWEGAVQLQQVPPEVGWVLPLRRVIGHRCGEACGGSGNRGGASGSGSISEAPMCASAARVGAVLLPQALGLLAVGWKENLGTLPNCHLGAPTVTGLGEGEGDGEGLGEGLGDGEVASGC